MDSLIDLERVGAGLADPVHDAQRVFRAALTALAEPGRVVALGALPSPPPGLCPAQGALLLALADRETPVWLDAPCDDAATRDYLRFHCGSPLVASSAAARFAVLSDLARLPALERFAAGDPDYPDRSATLLVAVRELAEGGPLQLRGPGIRDTRSLHVSGWSERCSAFFAANHARFPLGVDVFLCCGHALAALPRTCRVEPVRHTAESPCT